MSRYLTSSLRGRRFETRLEGSQDESGLFRRDRIKVEALCTQKATPPLDIGLNLNMPMIILL